MVPPDATPFELIKKPIRPIGVPLDSYNYEIPVYASSENELIVEKSDDLGGKKGYGTPMG